VTAVAFPPRLPERIRTLALFVSLAALSVACDAPVGPREPATSPELAALDLFALAAEPDASAQDLETLFGPADDPETLAGLRDALDAIAGARDPSIVSAEPLDELDAVALDLVASCEGGGEAHYSVRAERRGPEHWIVRWFRGPGAEWPSYPRPRGEGLSSSPPR
jgi:hypothetical protein